MTAIRTQVYLAPELRTRVDDYCRRTGKSVAEVIREALEGYLSEARYFDQSVALDRTFGMLPDLEVPSRHEW
jgi:predicted DNA-binding protein